MKRKSLLLATVAAALVIAMGISPAWAYFTDTSTVQGALTINVKPSTDITEWYGARVKHVVVTNSEDATAPVFVRARAFAPEKMTATVAGASWTGPDAQGWYEYSEIVEPGNATQELTVTLTFPPVKSETAPTGAVVGDNYNVVVVYESTPVQYRADGTPYADWSLKLNSGSTGGEE